MSLLEGTVLGQYEILGPLGAGGMGEVYRARDRELGREVAIKVLGESFAGDADRMARFEREAKLLASLNHANIATLYGSEVLSADDGAEARILVMELVDGETLAERLGRGPLPVDDAVELFGQIAEGLEAAHEKGVIHRDLKPANIKITPDGAVKILDFGLAKAMLGGEASGPQLSQSPTLSVAATQRGEILGTAAYMSPEQARGKPVDKRTDIWAFGAVLYEALSGSRAFGGETATDSLARILERTPDWQALPPATPGVVRELLRRCLVKDPRDRLRDIGDARIELGRVGEPGSELDDSKASRGAGRGTAARSILWSLAGVVVGAVLATLIFVDRKADSAHAAGLGVRRVIVDLDPDAPLALASDYPYGSELNSLALAPDGSKLVYVGTVDGVRQLFVRSLDRFETRSLAGTQGAFGPFFSPDGRHVAFFRSDELSKVALTGGQPVTLCPARIPDGGSWADDGTIYFSGNDNQAIFRVSKDGGEPVLVSATGYGGRLLALPGGRGVLFEGGGVRGGTGSAAIFHVAPGSDTLRVVVEDASDPKYLSSDRLLFMRRGELVAAAFDLQTLEIRGDPVPVLGGIRDHIGGEPQIAVSASGSVAYVPATSRGLSIPAWLDLQGRIELLPVPPQAYGTFQLSPDNTRLAIAVSGAQDQIFIHDFERASTTQLTFEGSNGFPIWKPDGRAVAFRSNRDSEESGDFQIFVKDVDGGADPERLVVTDVGASPYSWSPDGWLLFDVYTQSMPDLQALSPSGETVKVLTSDDGEWGPYVSWDSHWLAYTGNKTGHDEVYVRPFPAGDREWQISTAGGEEPVWSRDGKRLYYRNIDEWMVVDITTEPDFRAGPPRLLFAGPYVNVIGRSYDVSADDERVLVLTSTLGEPEITQVRLIVNWFDELEERMTSGGSAE